ncbi:MAG: FeoA family protein [candidate division KSB1 bacterium]|nr:FeoA family protein [candidate division KSB1 bacterium]MDQ7064403.1 FeoA family protein [candidate division KSB1 bacterium]
MKTQLKSVSDRVFSLDDLKPGEEAIIAGYRDDIADELRLLEMGLIIGSVVRLVKFAPFGDPIQIRVRGTDLSLRRALAKSILTRPTHLNRYERRN